MNNQDLLNQGASSSFTIEELEALNKKALEGKQNVPGEKTPPTGQNQEAAAGDSSLADTSLESLGIDAYLLKPEDLEGSEEEVRKRLKYRMAAIGIEIEEAFPGLDAIDLFSKDGERSGSYIGSKRYKGYALKQFNDFIKEHGDLNYGNQMEEENKEALQGYYDARDAARVDEDTWEENYINSTIEDFKEIEALQNGPGKAKLNATGLLEKKGDYYRKKYEEWKETGVFSPTDKEIETNRLEKEAADINLAGENYVTDLENEQRPIIKALVSKKGVELEYRIKNAEKEAASINASADNINQQIDSFKLNPTQEGYTAIQESVLDYITNKDDFENFIDSIDSKETKDLLAAVKDFNKDYSLISLLGVAGQETATSVAAFGADLLLKRMETGIGMNVFETAILSSVSPEARKILADYTRARIDQTILDASIETDIAREMLAQGPTLEQSFNSIGDFTSFAARTAVQAAPSVAMAYTGAVAMPLFFASGYGGAKIENLKNDYYAARGLESNLLILEKHESGEEILDQYTLSFLKEEIKDQERILNLTDAQKVGRQVVGGIAEVAFEGLSKIRIVKGANRAINPLKPRIHVAIGKSMVQEGLSEGATEFVNNWSKNAILGENNNLFEGVGEAMFGGVLVGGMMEVMGSAPAAYSAAAFELMTAKEQRAYKNKIKKLQELTGLKDLNDVFDPRLSQPMTQEVSELVEELQSDAEFAKMAAISRVGSTLTVEDAIEIGKINIRMRRLNERLMKAARSGRAQGAGMMAAIKEMEAEFNKLSEEKDAIIGGNMQGVDPILQNAATQVGFASKAALAQMLQNQTGAKAINSARRFKKLSEAAKNDYKKKAAAALEQRGEEATKGAIENEAILQFYTSENANQIAKDKKSAEDLAKAMGMNITFVEMTDAEYNAKFGNDSEANYFNGKLYVNTELAALNGRVGVYSHELLHAIATNKLGEGNENAAGKNLLAWMEKNSPEAHAYVMARLERDYDGSNAYYEEAMNALSDYIAEGGKLDMPTVMRLKTFFNDLFNKASKTDRLSLKDGKQTYAFIARYANRNAKTSALVKLFGKDYQEDDAPDNNKKGKRKFSVSNKKELYQVIKDVQPKKAETKAEFQSDPGFTELYMLMQPGQAVHNFIVSKFPGQVEKVRGVIESLEERLINFDPQSKRKGTSEEIGTDGFVEFLMANINFATLDANKKLAKEAAREKQTTSTDNEGAKQIADETTDASPQVSVKPEYKSLLRRRVVSEDVVKNIEQKVLRIVTLVKSRIDAKISNNVTVTPLIREIKKEAGKMVDIELKKVMGGKKDGELRKFLLRNKAAILENMSTTWLSQAMPFAIQKRVEGVWTSDWKGKKVDREAMSTDLAGRTSGADMVRRVPKIVGAISDTEFLAAIVDAKGAPLRGKKESLAKAMAEEITFDIIKKSFDENGPIAQAIIENQKRSGVENAESMGPEFKRQAERGNVKFSATAVKEQRSTLIEYFTYARYTNIGRYGRQLVTDKNIDALLNEYGLKDRYDLSDPEQFEQYLNDIETILLPLMPKWFWLTPGTKYSPLLSNKKSLGKTNKKLTDAEFSALQQQVIDKINSIDESKFGKPIKGIDISRPKFQRFLKSGNLGKREMYLTAKNIFLRENTAKGATVRGDVLAYNLYAEAIHEAMWQRAAEAIEKDINNARAIGTFMSLSTSDVNHPQRLARIAAWSKDFERKDITIEHAFPNMIVATTLLNKALAVHPEKNKSKKKKVLAGARVDFNTFYKAVAENYVVVALNKADDKKSSKFFRSTLPEGWNILEDNWYDRYFNNVVSKIDGGIDPNSLILPSGRSIAEVTGISKNGSYHGAKLKEFMEKENLDTSSSESAQAKQAVMSEAFENGQRKYSKLFSEPSILRAQFNAMLSRKSGIDGATEISRARGQILGRGKGRFKFFIAPGADDFRGLVHYAFAGQGKQGEKDMEFFEKNLMDPYFRGIAAIDSMRQLIKREFKVVTKEFKDEYKMLSEQVPGTPYTYDHALRVYMWGLAGTEVSGLDKRDLNTLENAILDNPALADFAEALLIVGRREAWPKPSEFWLGDSVLSDLNSMTEKVGRKDILAQFITNVDAMFDEATLNKIEAIKGRKHREALEDSIYAMKNGSNRPSGANIQTNKWINWINGSTGAIMFFNRRSALLQMLSFTNFINWSDNNPIKAAAAFANQKQYWKDFVFIFNSDKLKERRGGLKQDVSESEIAQIAGSSKNSPQAMLAYMLKIGFTPTQIADSFAIATGGASFYRNRVNTYSKEMSQKEAEEKAFEDFSKASDVAQQSSDPALVSQQQRSILGRFLLAFANTPMQYTRLMKKAGQDLINGRGNAKEHISKILYYGFIQNFIFSALQSAMFGLFFDDEEDDEIRKKNADKKLLKTVNSMVDTVLRGSGVYGAVLSTIKNTIQTYYAQEEKGFMANHAYTLLSAFNVSPPIGSKFRKLHTAIQTKKFEKDAIAERGWALTANGRVNLGPNWAVLGSLVSGAANIPLDRVYDEISSISEALDARNKAWQRIALALGWKSWDVGAKNEEHDLIETLAKEKRKKEGIEKAKETRRKKKKSKFDIDDRITE